MSKEITKIKSIGVRTVIGYLVTIVCILCLSFGITAKGKKIYKQLQQKEEEQYGSDANYEEFLPEFLQTIYQIYMEYQQDETQEYESASEYYLGIDSNKLERETQYYDEQDDTYYPKEESEWGEKVKQQYRDIYELNQRIYLSQHLLTTQSVIYSLRDDVKDLYTMQNSLTKVLENETITSEIANQYPIVCIVSFDGEGKAVIKAASGTTNEMLQKSFDAIQPERIFTQEAKRRVSNCTIVLAVNKDAVRNLRYYDNGYYYNEYEYQFISWDFLWIAVASVGVVVLLMILLMLLGFLGRRDCAITRIPVEISAGGIILLSAGYLVVSKVTYQIYNINKMEIYSNKETTQTAIGFMRTMQKVMPVALWFVYLLLFSILFIALFQIFNKGIKRFVKENCWFYAICRWIKRVISRVYDHVVAFDFEDNANKTALKIVVFNAAIIAVMCSIWIYGLGVLLIYSCILFYLLSRYMNRVKKNYAQVLSATSTMANGDLHVTINEDLGLFNPLKDELMHVQDGFSNAVAAEVKSQNMKNELITNVSHDLKTPLTAIITYVELLKDENITEEQKAEYIETLSAKSMRLKQLIEDLFEVSKLNSNNVQLNLMTVDLIELIKQAECEFEDKFIEQGIELRSKLPEEKVMLQLDSQKSYRIFENLFGNIVKYALPNTRAYVEVTQEAGQVDIILRNISANEITVDSESLTERFVRGDQSRNTEGSGLGLAIVKSLVEKQGGKFQIILDGDLFKVLITFPYQEPDEE